MDVLVPCHPRKGSCHPDVRSVYALKENRNLVTVSPTMSRYFSEHSFQYSLSNVDTWIFFLDEEYTSVSLSMKDSFTQKLILQRLETRALENADLA